MEEIDMTPAYHYILYMWKMVTVNICWIQHRLKEYKAFI